MLIFTNLQRSWLSSTIGCSTKKVSLIEQQDDKQIIVTVIVGFVSHYNFYKSISVFLVISFSNRSINNRKFNIASF